MIKPSQCLHSRKQWARPPNQNRLRLRNHTHIEFTLVKIREIAVFFNLRFYWLSIICNNGNGIIRRMRILYWISTIFICDRTSLLSFVCSAQLPQSRNRKRIWAITMLVCGCSPSLPSLLCHSAITRPTPTPARRPQLVCIPHGSNLAPALFIHITFFTTRPALITVSWYHMLALISGEAVQRRPLYYGWRHERYTVSRSQLN